MNRAQAISMSTSPSLEDGVISTRRNLDELWARETSTSTFLEQRQDKILNTVLE